MKACAFDPKERYESAEAMLEAFEGMRTQAGFGKLVTEREENKTMVLPRNRENVLRTEEASRAEKVQKPENAEKNTITVKQAEKKGSKWKLHWKAALGAGIAAMLLIVLAMLPHSQNQTDISDNTASYSEDLVLKNEAPDSEEAIFTCPEIMKYAFGTEILKEDVVSIEFLRSLNTAPDDAKDVSENGNGKVLLWSEPADYGKQRLFIAGDGAVCFPENSAYLFGGYFLFADTEYINLHTITFSDAVDTSNVTNMKNMFAGCSSLRNVDIEAFDTSKVRNMESMFSRCYSLTNIDLSEFDTSQVTSMNGMFSSCSSLNSLELENFDTSRVTDMQYMFELCTSLSNLNLDSFDTSNVKDMTGMFLRCFMLKNLNIVSA